MMLRPDHDKDPLTTSSLPREGVAVSAEETMTTPQDGAPSNNDDATMGPSPCSKVTAADASASVATTTLNEALSSALPASLTTVDVQPRLPSDSALLSYTTTGKTETTIATGSTIDRYGNEKGENYITKPSASQSTGDGLSSDRTSSTTKKDLDEAVLIRRRAMNTIHSRRKRERQRIEIEVLKEQCSEFTTKNMAIQQENMQLEAIIKSIQSRVIGHEANPSHRPPQQQQQLQALPTYPPEQAQQQLQALFQQQVPQQQVMQSQLYSNHNLPQMMPNNVPQMSFQQQQQTFASDAGSLAATWQLFQQQLQQQHQQPQQQSTFHTDAAQVAAPLSQMYFPPPMQAQQQQQMLSSTTSAATEIPQQQIQQQQQQLQMASQQQQQQPSPSSSAYNNNNNMYDPSSFNTANNNNNNHNNDANNSNNNINPPQPPHPE